MTTNFERPERRPRWPADGPRWPKWHRAVAHAAIVVAFVMVALGYAPDSRTWNHGMPVQKAGQPLNPYVTFAHVALARADALAGDSPGARKHIEALAHDMARSAGIPDAARPIDHEAARAVVRPLRGVRSAVWLDHDNFVVMVADAEHRSAAMIDRVCTTLAPLGDTLAVVVSVQDASARNPDAATTLSRNCQLPPGQRAFLQRNRTIDAVSPALRLAFKAQQTPPPADAQTAPFPRVSH